VTHDLSMVSRILMFCIAFVLYGFELDEKESSDFCS